MRRLTTLAMVLVLLGGMAGCGESAAQKEAHRQQAQQTATEHATEEKEQARKREEEAHPEFSPNSKYVQERSEGEERQHEAGEPPNAEVAQKDMEAAERVEKAGEGKEPAHTAEWYREQEREIALHEENLTEKAACREKHGPEAEVTNLYRTANPEYPEAEYATCKSPNGESWRVKPEAVPPGAEERIPRLYSEG